MIFKLGVIVDFSDLVFQWGKGKDNFERCLEEIRETEERQKEISHRTNIYVSNIFGDLFVFSIDKIEDGSGYSLHIWDNSGSERIFLGSIKTEKNWEEAGKHLERYSLGEIKCHGCGNWVDKKDGIKGYCYAGRYCLGNEECKETYKESRKHLTTF